MMHVRENVVLSDCTTIGLGGPARYFVECSSVAEVQEAIVWAREHDVSMHILGGGSNSLFADEGFAGLVVAIRIMGIEFEDGGVVTAGAGEQWDSLVVQSIERGLAGIECLSGIPGLVGATPMQNVGAYGQEVAEVIVLVDAVDRTTGQIVTFTNEECQFAYRGSRFKSDDAEKYIITSVQYALKSDGEPTLRYPQLASAAAGVDGSGEAALKRVRQAVLALRRSKSMLVDAKDPNSRSCGSFFVNPVIPKEHLQKIQQQFSDVPFFTGEETPHGSAAANWAEHSVKIPAAWLVEHAGFSKGFRRKGVGISDNHPLALVNHGGTTTALLELAADIQNAVLNKFEIQLEREPVVVSSQSELQ
jgi:UDP-N-acetylmuramate dehydrogenase